MADELIDIVNGRGRVVRQAAKSEAHTHGWLHKTVIGYVRTNTGWALVRQAADRQDAGQLVAPVGGHVQAGESELDALLRESEEEIGTRNIRHRLVGRKRFHRHVIGRNENHLFIIYEISTDDEITLGAEAVSFETFTATDLKKALAETPEQFGDSYFFVLEHFYPTFLPQAYAYRYRT
jgi:8-oxo-dGTP pyrophosphatase MutT (NUDIX family)